MHPDETYAKIGYEAYAVSTGGKTFDGRDMPKWPELPERIRDAWRAATDAALEHYFKVRDSDTSGTPKEGT